MTVGGNRLTLVMRSFPNTCAFFVALAAAACSTASNDAPSAPTSTSSSSGGDAGGDASRSPDAGVDGLTLAVCSASLLVAAGYKASCDVSITRTGGLDDAVTISAAGVPAGVTVADVVLAKSQTRATLTIASTTAIPPTTLTLEAKANDEPTVRTSASLMLQVVAVPSGGLDPSFGAGGLAIHALGDFVPFATTLAPDGKIVVVGMTYPPGGAPSFLTAFRYRADGASDPTFGKGGRLDLTTVFPRDLSVVTLQPDGKILVGGESFMQTPMVLRLVDDGTPDATFGSMGQTQLVRSTWTDGSFRAVSVEPDGSILALANSMRDSPGLVSDGVLVRFLANGALDASFGDGGVVVSFPGKVGAGHLGGGALIRQPDGKHLTQPQGLRVVRLNADGSVDPTFTDTSTTFDTETPPVLDADGTVLAGDADATGLRIRRLTSAGLLDTTFGAAGFATLHFGTLAVPTTLVPAAGGGALVAGWSHDTPTAPEELALARLDAVGKLDTTFGASGVTLSPVGSYGARPMGVALQPDGRIVIVASLSGPSQASAGFALARYVP
jgi:uncharacterized delta-60 repeat protein